MQGAGKRIYIRASRVRVHPCLFAERDDGTVERTAPFLLWTAGIVQHWCLVRKNPALLGWRPRWWPRHRTNGGAPSFSDMLAALRGDILRGAFKCRSTSEHDLHEKLNTLIESAAFAA